MKRLTTVSIILTMMITLLVSCGECYNKMQKNSDQVVVNCVPEVLTLKGSTMDSEITVSFPAKYFNAKAILRVTPVLVFEGGELEGIPMYLQGEDVIDNFTVISREGGSYTQTASFPFENIGLVATLELRLASKCFGKSNEEGPEYLPLATIAIANGVSAVQSLTNTKEGICDLQFVEPNFQRGKTLTEEAQISYNIQSSVVRKAQLSKEQVSLFKEFIEEQSKADRTTLSSIHADGYASPDGPESMNNTLSANRSKSGVRAIKRELKEVESLNYEVASFGEDWDGFKELVEASDIKDKELILNVLKMYSSSVERDREIYNMSAVFKVLAKDILPQLRRTKLSVEAYYEGLTDQEILVAAIACDTNLDVEHLLYAATLTDNLTDKVAIYSFAAKTFNDARAYNNLAVVKAQSNEMAEAKTLILKSLELASCPIGANNFAAIAIAMGDLESAKQALNGLNDARAKKSMGIIALLEGNYQVAKANLSGYNLAIAEICDNNITGAKKAIADVECPCADYVRAIIANREGDTEKAKSFLNAATAANQELKERAENDIEFANLVEVDVVVVE